MSTPHFNRHADLDALQTRFALRVSAALGEGGNAVPHDISERLRIAREQAVARARPALQAAAAPAVISRAGGAAVLGSGPSSWWLRLASLSPLIMLVAGLVLIQHQYVQEQIRAAADVDAALLADDLPPAAYRDPGFAEFLKQPDTP